MSRAVVKTECRIEILLTIFRQLLAQVKRGRESPHSGDVTLSWMDVDQLTTNGLGATWTPTRITDVATDGDGIWLVSLTCGSCRNPAPWFLSRLSPSER